MAEPSKRPNIGLIGAIVAAVAAAGGGGAYWLLGNQQAAQAPASSTAAGGDAVVGVQSAPSDQGAAMSPQDPASAATGAASAGDAVLPPMTDRGGGQFEISDPAIELSLKLPQAPANDPLVTSLRAEAEATFKSAYSAARAEYNNKDNPQARTTMPWSQTIAWDYSARAGDIVSLIGHMEEWSGGAHPNHGTEAVIARKDGARMAFSDMLLASSNPSPALTIAVCEGVKREKVARISEATILSEPIICAGPNANVEAKTIALAPSNEAGKFGGVYIYFDPYEIGAYAEGTYVVTIQQAVFALDLKLEFRSLFGGTAPPAKD